MVRWIEHVREPDRLVLTWQSPDLSAEDRMRYAVADLFRDEEDAYLIYRENDDVERARGLGYVGYPAFRPGGSRHSSALSAFVRRIPPRGRSDFSRYLENYRLKDTSVSDFALLGYTEAKLPTDGFSLVDTLESAVPPSEYLLEVAGYRHYLENSKDLEVGEMLSLALEPDNKFDPGAVMIQTRGRCIGYINRIQAPVVSRWVTNSSVSAWLERKNGTEGRPRAYIFVEVR